VSVGKVRVPLELCLIAKHRANGWQVNAGHDKPGCYRVAYAVKDKIAGHPRPLASTVPGVDKVRSLAGAVIEDVFATAGPLAQLRE
jgi:hypothetical protein